MNDTPNLRVVPSGTDVEAAADLREKMIEALNPVLLVLDEAGKKGFEIAFAVGKSPIGKNAITALRIVKEY